MTNSPYQDALEHLEKMIRIAAPLILDIQDRKAVIESHLFLADAKKRMAAFTRLKETKMAYTPNHLKQIKTT